MAELWVKNNFACDFVLFLSLPVKMEELTGPYNQTLPYPVVQQG